MNVNKRIDTLSEWGQWMIEHDHSSIFKKAYHHNGWFTQENSATAIEAIATRFLDPTHLSKWTAQYAFPEVFTDKQIALIMAGNIPAVGFHDLLCVLMSGHIAQVKLSSKDDVLIPYLFNALIEIEPAWKDRMTVVEQIKNFDAVIATGSNNSSLYFETYFGKYPHIIRKNRTSVAIIDQEITDESIRLIGKDLFAYFGLGCRNVSKLYIHDAIPLERLMELWHEEKELVLHHKYKNNYDYNYSIELLNKSEFLMNGACILKKDKSIFSPIAVVHYERYNQIEDIKKALIPLKDQIQCVVSSAPIPSLEIVSPGHTQQPAIDQYADGVDTVQFLLAL